MKEKYTIAKNNDPTAYNSNSDAIIDLEDVYNKIATLYLGNTDYETSDGTKEVTKNSVI